MNRDITYWEVVIGRVLCDIWVRWWCALQWVGTYPPIFLTCLTQFSLSSWTISFSQDEECKNKSSAKGFTKGQPWQQYNYWGGRHFHCSISKFIKEAKVLHETLKSDNRFSEAAKAYISDSLPPSLALTDSESLSDSDSDQWQTLWHYFNNQSVLTKLLFNSFF